MMDINPRLIFLIVFVGILSALMYKDRKNVNRVSILFYRRTKRGLDLIDRIAKKAPRFWKAYGWAGFGVGVISVFVAVQQIGSSLLRIGSSTGGSTAGPKAVLPGLGAEASINGPAFFIPVEYWIISIGVLMFVHEMSHGIVARAEDFELNSVGWIVLGIIPGAFVEPKGEKMLPNGDGEQEVDGEHHGMWDQGNWKSRIKVLSAGSFANYLTAILFIVLAIGLATATTDVAGLNYQAQEGYPAYESGMRNGTLYEINNHTIDSPESMNEATDSIQANDTVRLSTSEGNFTLTATEREGFEGGYIGLGFTGQSIEYNESVENYSGFLSWFTGLLEMIAILNIGIGLFNMLPAKPLDGGHILGVFVEQFTGEENMKYVNAFSMAVWALIISSFVYLIFLA
ncbi:MAG: membrane-associated protease RseP (regulator of RpoE activity) [Colwellia polaris]|jgi:membrane-associated protease RseP (regulator of RpoE activity)